MHHFVAIGEFKLELQSGNAPNLGQIGRFSEPRDLEIWRMTLKNNRSPLLRFLQLCASFRSHLCIQTGVTVQKRPIWVNSTIFRAMWRWNLTDDLEQGKSEGFDSCDRPSNLTQIGFKSSIFQPVWPWYLMDDPKNNRAPLLCYFKFFASFRSHWWIQTGVTVRKRLIWVKIDAFLAVWPWNLTDDLQKQ